MPVIPIVLLTSSGLSKGGNSSAAGAKATVKVLIEGYAREVENGWVASSASCLVVSSGMKIVTDPGCNRKKLMDALSRENLTTDDIDYVFLSHGHPDHTMLCGIFAKAKMVTYDENLVYDQDLMVSFDKHIFGPDTEIVSTPGHTPDHLSLLVDTADGLIAIAGDVFWWADGEQQDAGTVPAQDDDQQQAAESRDMLLRMAGFIVPGHGKMFRVQKKE